MKCNYLIVDGNVNVKCNSFEDVVRALVDENYYQMSDDEKKEAIKKKAIANSLNVRPFSKDGYLTNFDLENERTYILSLLELNIVYLLERKEGGELTKDLDIPEDSKNYVVVNSHARKLLDDYKKEKDNDKSKDDSYTK